MSAEENDVPSENPTHLQIKLKDDRDNEVYFKVKPTTPLSKVITAYCAQQGVAENTLRFFFDNHRITKEDTPQKLEMEDGDMVDVHQEQTGGADDPAGSNSGSAEPELQAPTHLTIRVKDQAEGVMEFRLKMITPMKKMMTKYCETKAVNFGSVRFLHDGVRLNLEDTAETRGIEDKDEIQAFIEQQGGDGSPKLKEKEKSHLEIRVKDQQENEISFKIKKTTALGKVMVAYCQRNEKDPKAVRFLFEGQRINENDTPEKLEMEDGDLVEVFLEQLGGRCF